MHIIIDLIKFAFDLVTFRWAPGGTRPFFLMVTLVALVYVFIVRPKIEQYRLVTGILDKADAEGYSAWQSFLSRLSGYKTVLLGSMSAILPAFPQVLDEINSFTGWGVFLEQGLANKISAVLAALTAVTHVFGLVSAAKIVPVASGDAVTLPAPPRKI